MNSTHPVFSIVNAIEAPAVTRAGGASLQVESRRGRDCLFLTLGGCVGFVATLAVALLIT